MTRRKRFWQGLGAAALCLFASQLKAQEQNLAVIYAPDALRAAYARESRDWQPLPPWIVQSFLVWTDQKFFFADQAAWRSRITKIVSLHFPETRMPARLAPIWVIAGTLTKTEILNLFVHLPHYWGRDCYGIEAAALVYFGKAPARLDLHEAAFLASVIYEPSRIENRAWSLRRRNMLLRMMAEKGVILPQEARQAMARPLGLSDPSHRCPPMQDEKPDASGETQRVIPQP